MVCCRLTGYTFKIVLNGTPALGLNWMRLAKALPSLCLWLWRNWKRHFYLCLWIHVDSFLSCKKRQDGGTYFKCSIPWLTRSSCLFPLDSGWIPSRHGALFKWDGCNRESLGLEGQMFYPMFSICILWWKCQVSTREREKALSTTKRSIRDTQ